MAGAADSVSVLSSSVTDGGPNDADDTDKLVEPKAVWASANT